MPRTAPGAAAHPELPATSGNARSGRGWVLFRAALAFSGLWLTGYVVYRYGLFHPPDHGTTYGKIFPFSLLLAATALALALRPTLLRAIGGGIGTAWRGLFTAVGGIWMATGVGCVASLGQGIAEAPLGGSIDMIHMLSDHVFLPLAIAALAWAPERVAAFFGATTRNERGAGAALAPPRPSPVAD